MKDIPLDIFRYKILPYCSTAEELTKLKIVCKQYNNMIITHKPVFKCVRCKRNRFSVSERCQTKNCMSLEFIHPICKYFDMSGNTFCSYSCMILYSQS